MRHVIATLWAGDDLPNYSGNKYGLQDVLRLWKGVRRCVTDGVLHIVCDDHYYDLLTTATASALASNYPGLRETCFIHRMKGYGIGGWTPVLESFSEEALAGLFMTDSTVSAATRFLLVGLDTIFVRNSDWLFDWNEAPVGIPADPYDPINNKPCDAVVTFNVHGANIVWSEYKSSRLRVPFPHMYADHPSEMVLLQALQRHFGWPLLEGKAPKKLVSYKANNVKRDGVPPDATIIYFHGHPKPSDLSEDDPINRFLAVQS